MHSVIYRTELLRESGLRLPEHCFYVDNIYAFEKWCDKDRLQFVATYATPNNKWNFNAGYSCRFKSGFIANVRYNIQNGCRLQGKFDAGAKNIQASFIWDFN